MRFKSYMNENENDDDIIVKYETLKKIWKDCQPFLKEVKSNNLLFSGRNNKDEVFIGKVRKNRRPKDTFQEIHEDLDDEFNRKFGVRARSNALFCTGSQMDAGDYGRIYSIFPIGKFDIIYSPEIDDLYRYLTSYSGFSMRNNNGIRHDVIDTLYVEVNDIYKKVYGKPPSSSAYLRQWASETDNKEVRDLVDPAYEKSIRGLVSRYTKGKVNDAALTGNEIMLSCDKYYAVLGREYTALIQSVLYGYKNKLPTLEEFTVVYRRLKSYLD